MITKSKKQKDKENNIELNIEDFRKLIGGEWDIFQEKIIANCYCAHCKSDYGSAIINYSVTINNLNDIVLRGSCKKCKGPVNRYVETGETDKYKTAIDDIRRRYDKN